MTYFPEMDELPDDRILFELKRRFKLVAEGKCTYCGHLVTSEACKHPELHRKREFSVEMLAIGDYLNSENKLPELVKSLVADAERAWARVKYLEEGIEKCRKILK